MRKLKKALSLFLALAMMLSLCVTGFAAKGDTVDTYDDYTATDNEAEIAVDILTQLGYVEGYEDGEFKADYNFTREQAAKIITYIMAGYDAGYAIYKTEVETGFDDVDSTRWSSGVVAYAASQDVIAGYGDGTYGPEDTLTEAQWIKMLLVAVLEEDSEQFIGDGWETAAIDKAINLGLLTTDEYTANSSSLTREWACVLAVRAMLMSSSVDGTRGALYVSDYAFVEDGYGTTAPYTVYSTVNGETATIYSDVYTVITDEDVTEANIKAAVGYDKETNPVTIVYYVDGKDASTVIEALGSTVTIYEVDEDITGETIYVVEQVFDTYTVSSGTVTAAASIDGYITALAGDYPDYSYIEIDGVEYTFSYKYNYTGDSEVLNLNGQYIFYLDQFGNILYVQPYKYELISDQGLAYVKSAAVYASATGVKGDTAYDYSYVYEFQITLEVVIVPDESGYVEVEYIDLALVEIDGEYYAMDECGLADLSNGILAYSSLIEDLIAATSSASSTIKVLGLEFPVIGGSAKYDIDAFYTYYTSADGEMILSENVTDADILITGGENLYTVDYNAKDDIDAVSDLSYTEITVWYNNGSIDSIYVAVDEGVTTGVEFGKGVVTENSQGYVTDIVTITAATIPGSSFVGIYAGSEKLTNDGAELVIGTSYDGLISCYTTDYELVEDLEVGSVYLFCLNADGYVTEVNELYIKYSGYVYAIDSTYLSLASSATKGYSSYVYGADLTYVYVNDLFDSNDNEVEYASYTVGSYVNLYVDDNGNILFITVGHSYGPSDYVLGDEAISITGQTCVYDFEDKVEKAKDTTKIDAGTTYELKYYNDMKDVKGDEIVVYAVEAVGSAVAYGISDGAVVKDGVLYYDGENAGILKYYVNTKDSTDTKLVSVVTDYEITDYSYEAVTDEDGNITDVTINATVEAGDQEFIVPVESATGTITAASSKTITGIAGPDDEALVIYANALIAGTSIGNYEIDGSVTLAVGLTVTYATDDNEVIYAVVYKAVVYKAAEAEEETEDTEDTENSTTTTVVLGLYENNDGIVITVGGEQFILSDYESVYVDSSLNYGDESAAIVIEDSGHLYLYIYTMDDYLASIA